MFTNFALHKEYIEQSFRELQDLPHQDSGNAEEWRIQDFLAGQPWWHPLDEATRNFIYHNLLTGAHLDQCQQKVVFEMCRLAGLRDLDKSNMAKLKQLPVGSAAPFLFFNDKYNSTRIAIGDRDEVDYLSRFALAHGWIMKLGHGHNPLPGILPGRSIHGEYVVECNDPEYGERARNYLSGRSKKEIRR
ncbi:hypothetical protein [Streptomyces sp. NPDC047981]|uniref:hypothetical protein n=1 Tax=Streptomyces sp. NPDC047981 TaxID=3154610 RepID=UPI0034368496